MSEKISFVNPDPVEQHIKIFRENNDYVIMNEKTAQRITVSKGAAKYIARFLMIELNVVDAMIIENDKALYLREVDKSFKAMSDFKTPKHILDALKLAGEK